MGESMVVVARSNRLANKMCEHLNARARFLKRDIGYKYDFEWGVKKGRRLSSNFTHHRGIARVAVMAVSRWAAMTVGRRQRSFPGLAEGPCSLAGPIPYVRYGDFQSWPIFGPGDWHLIPNDKFDWCKVLTNGMAKDPVHAALYMGYEHPKFMALLAKAQKQVGIDPKAIEDGTQERDIKLFRKACDLHEELMRPWLAKKLKPLRSAMTSLVATYDPV